MHKEIKTKVFAIRASSNSQSKFAKMSQQQSSYVFSDKERRNVSNVRI